MAKRFRLEPTWRMALPKFGICQETVLRRAGLPLNLLNGPSPFLTETEYHRFIEAIDAESDRPELGLRLGQIPVFDAFEPMTFAAACSPNLESALARMTTYRLWMSPFLIRTDWRPQGLQISFDGLGHRRIPRLRGIVEMTFIVHWLRQATRKHIKPVRVGMPELPDNGEPYFSYFGTRPEPDRSHSVQFAYLDSQRPFVHANSSIWDTFPTELRRRLGDLEGSARFVETVRVSLLELLPSGRANKDQAAQSLGMGPRTLQRRLRDEGTSFRRVLASTRCDLVHHYLSNTDLTTPEIAYLLDFEDPNSLYRAFHTWTGTTPEAHRRAHNHHDLQ